MNISDLTVIDDKTLPGIITNSDKGRGYQGMFRGGYKATPTIQPFPEELRIPESEWKQRIDEMTARQSRLSDIIKQAGVPVLDQKQTNFCWSFATVASAMVVRAFQNQEMVIGSPASVACPITNFRNEGGYGEDAINQIAQHGIVPAQYWPPTAINKTYNTSHNWELAAKYKVTEWWRLTPRSLNDVVSLLLRRIPVSAGYNWWGHQVLLVDAFYKDGKIAILARNSWGNVPGYPDGWFVLTGNHAIPDDAVAPRVMVAA